MKLSHSNSARRHSRRLLAMSVLAAELTLSRVPARAQTAAASAAPVPLQDINIVVSATGIPTPAADLGSSVTVITADQIAAQQNRTITDVLNQVPGLNVVQAGGPGAQTSVYMRGANSNHVKVLIDGIDAGDPTTPNSAFDFGQLLTGDIARVEVLRGPQSGLYGSDAIGGVISITTKAGYGPPKATAGIEGGTFGTFNEKLGFSGSSSIFSYALNIQHFRSTNTPVVPEYMLPPAQRANDNSYDNYPYSARLGADLTDSFGLHAIARFTDATLLFTGDQNGPCFCMANASRSEQINRQFYTRGEAVWHSLDNRFTTTVGVNYANLSTYEADPPAQMSPSTTYIGQRLTVDLKQEVQVLETQKLVLGALDQSQSANTGTAVYTDRDRGAYAELQSRFNNRFFVVSNIRYDNFSSFGDHFTYRIAPAFIVPETDTKLKASLGTGFKAPSLSQLYQNFPAYNFYANPNLQPEQSTGYDIGFEQPSLNDRVRIGSTYFHNNITDLIDSNATFTSYANVGRALTYGAESFVAFTVNEQLKLRTDYTYTFTQNLDTGVKLPRRPKDKVTLQATWTPIDRLQLSATALFINAWQDINALTYASQLAQAYGTVNLAANYDVNEQIHVFARIDNLFNRQYEDPLGYLHPGIGAYAGVRVAAF